MTERKLILSRGEESMRKVIEDAGYGWMIESREESDAWLARAKSETAKQDLMDRLNARMREKK